MRAHKDAQHDLDSCRVTQHSIGGYIIVCHDMTRDNIGHTSDMCMMHTRNNNTMGYYKLHGGHNKLFSMKTLEFKAWGRMS